MFAKWKTALEKRQIDRDAQKLIAELNMVTFIVQNSVVTEEKPNLIKEIVTDFKGEKLYVNQLPSTTDLIINDLLMLSESVEAVQIDIVFHKGEYVLGVELYLAEGSESPKNDFHYTYVQDIPYKISISERINLELVRTLRDLAKN